MKYFFFLGVFLATMNGWSWQELPNAGGGIKANGGYLTFYSAKVPVVPTELMAAEIPGMKYLTDQIMSWPMSAKNRYHMLSLVYPTQMRSYYKLDQSKLSAEQLSTLLKEYSHLAGVPESSLVLFAVTSPSQQITALFPTFYELKKETEQAALLLHEASWIGVSQLYSDVVRFEMAAQAYFENAENPDNYYRFFSAFDRVFKTGGMEDTLLPASLRFDLKSGQLQGQMLLKDILGRDYLQCLSHDKSRRLSEIQSACNPALAMEILKISQAKSQSLFFRAFAERPLIITSVPPVIFSTDTDFDISWNKVDIDDVYVDFTKERGEYSMSFPLRSKKSKALLGYVGF